MTTAFNKSYQPAFPTLSVTLGEGSSQLGPFSALLDTGADATLIPTRLMTQMRVAEGRRIAIRSHFGERRFARLYVTSIAVERVLLPGVYVVGDAGTEIILGRDVLSKLPLFLDGPSQQTDLLDDATAKQLRARRK